MLALKQIEKPSMLSNRQHKIILAFLWGLITNNEHIKDNKWLFWLENTEYKLLDKQLSKGNHNIKRTVKTLKTKAMAEYLVWQSVSVELIWDWVRNHNYESLNRIISKHYLYPLILSTCLTIFEQI